MANSQQSNKVEEVTVVIPNGATQSEAIDLRGLGIFGILVPAGFAGTSITLEVTRDDSTFYPVLNRDGSAYTITVAASEYCALPISELPGLLKFRLVSSTTATGGETVYIYARSLD